MACYVAPDKLQAPYTKATCGRSLSFMSWLAVMRKADMAAGRAGLTSRKAGLPVTILGFSGGKLTRRPTKPDFGPVRAGKHHCSLGQ